MDYLLENFLKQNRGKHIKLIFEKGYQMPCRLMRYDEKFMELEIDPRIYGSSSVFVPFSAVSTFVAAKD